MHLFSACQFNTSYTSSYQIDESLLTIFCLINICACLSLSDEANKIIGELIFSLKKNPIINVQIRNGLGFCCPDILQFLIAAVYFFHY